MVGKSTNPTRSQYIILQRCHRDNGPSFIRSKHCRSECVVKVKVGKEIRPFSSPSEHYNHYHKSAYENLIDINNNLSGMLKESFAEIDNICHRVRMCLLEVNSHSKSQSFMVSDKTILSCHSAYTCQEFDKVDDQQHGDGHDEVMSDNADDVKEDERVVGDILEENEEDVSEGIVESIETQKSTPTCQLPMPFFTILNPNQSVESVGIKMSPMNKLSTKCLTDNFQKTMEEVEKLANYEQLLMNMVDDINREITNSYSEYPKAREQCEEDKCEHGKSSKGNKDLNKTKASKSSSTCKKTHAEALKNFAQIKKSQNDWNEDQFSENDLDPYAKMERRYAISVHNAKMDFTSPDVYRKRAITDLHKRLVAQVEANDSLIFFQKLMAKTKRLAEKSEPATTVNVNVAPERRGLRSPMEHLVKSKNTGKSQRSLADLSQKYHDSLWFRQKRGEVRRSKKYQNAEKKRKGKRFLKDDRAFTPQSYTAKSAQSVNKSSGPSRKQSQNTVCNYKVRVTNEQPLSEPAKCKMHFMRAKYFQMTNKKLKHLDILDDITKNDLVPIKSEYPRRDEIKRSVNVNVKDSYLYKLMYGKNRNIQNAWSQLFEPSIKCSMENCKQCSKTTINEGTCPFQKEAYEDKKGIIRESSEKGEVIQKLSKYIFSGADNFITKNNVYTIMPVHVFYDNYRPPFKKDDFHQKLPLLPMKECKENVKRGEWKDHGKKTKPLKVVYDPILRKIEKEIKMASARQPQRLDKSRSGHTNSWSPKNFSKYCTSSNTHDVQLNPTQKKDVLPKTAQKLKESKSSVPEAIKRSPKSVPIPKHDIYQHPLVPPLWNTYPDTLINKSEVSTKQKISKLTNKEEKRTKQKSLQQRKLWENKYGKSVGQKLINFVEKQPEVYSPPVPKYAQPKHSSEARQKLMFKQLLDLKQKNDNIQSNIQTAIEVIERKMIDIISKPVTSESMDAFDEMEKEITTVLNLMKSSERKGTPQQKSARLDKVEEHNEDIDKISDELFRRLDKILDSSELSLVSNCSKKVLKELKQLQTKDSSRNRSGDMKQICFSSTSASGEEKFTITAISPNRMSKNVSPPMAKSGLSPSHKTRNEEEKNLDIENLQYSSLKSNEYNVIPKLLETVVNLAFVEPVIQDCLNGNQLSDSSKSTELSSQEDKFSHGDFDNNHSSTKEEIQLEVTATTISNENKDDNVALCETVEHQECETQNTAKSHDEQIFDHISDSSIDIATNNTDTMYFTPQTSPLRRLRFEEVEMELVEETSDVQNRDIADNDDDNVINKDDDKKYSGEDEFEELVDAECRKRKEVKTAGDLDGFYDNVTKIIRRVEDVYSQLDQFEQEILAEQMQLNTPTESIFKESSKVEIESEVLLTPLIPTVKEQRTACSERTTTPRSIALGRSPSYYNVLSFLDTLADFREERPVEMYSCRICPTAFLVDIPLTFSFASIYNFATVEFVYDLPKKRSGCLKNPSIHSNVNSSKSKQKVSFLLQKLNKETQVTACPFHNAKRLQPECNIKDDEKSKIPTVPRVDQEVTATLDIKVSRSVDKMSSADESYQSTLETSDELSTGRYPLMSIETQKLHSDILETGEEPKKNVVEIFRINHKSEGNGTDLVKVFYDDYQNRQNTLDLKDFRGFYNEASLTEVKKSLSKNFQLKKRDSLEKLTKNIGPENFVSEIFNEVSLLEPLKNLNQFIDSALLKEAIETRKKLRMMRRKSLSNVTTSKKVELDENKNGALKAKGEKEGLLKGIYVFVYLLMFTALNLEFKCVQ